MNPKERTLYPFRRGQVISFHPREIWQIERGVLQLQTYTDQGTITVLGWLQKGSFWGSFITQLTTIKAIAFTDCSLTRYTIEELRQSVGLERELFQQTLHRLHQTEYLLAIAGLKRIEDRLIALFLLLKREMGQVQGEKTCLCYRFTHQNLADAIGTTRVTVTRLFKEFQQQGWLELDGDRHILLANNFEQYCPL